jgi:CBS domain-containing protein
MKSAAVNSIRAYPPFDRLGEAELKLVEQALETIHFAKGVRILTREGPPSQHLYLIRQGAVRLEREGQVAQVLEEADFFGYAPLLRHGLIFFDVVAEEEVEAYRLPAAVFHQLLGQPAFAEFFQKRSERLSRRVSDKIASLEGDMTSPAGDLIIRPPVYVPPEATIAEAAQVMLKAWVSSVLVQDEPPGILTDRDLRWILADGLSPETPVRQVMSQPLKSLPMETPVYGASLFMLEENIHHLPLTQAGQIVGLITDTDLLRHQAKSPLYLLKRVEKLSGVEPLARYGLEVSTTVERLFRGGVDVAQIGRVIASLNDALTKRLLKLAEEQLGSPPTPYAWIVFGSEGRQEQALLTDQDNALVYLHQTPEAQSYFAALTEWVVNGRLQAGFPRCPGGYMATNWHKPLEEWESLFRSWLRVPDPQALLETAIFFDFRPVYGQLSLEPLEQILAGAGKQKIFLAQLARAAVEYQPPLGFFRRFIVTDGQIDLKKGAIGLIVALARLYALEVGAVTRSTLNRLEAAAQASTLSYEGAETLAEAFRLALNLRLREQLRDYRAGASLTNQVRLERLSPLERRQLKEAFVAIRKIQEFTKQYFQTGRLG